jgi:maltooligosyltrehalose trehalohydrolase
MEQPRKLQPEYIIPGLRVRDGLVTATVWAPQTINCCLFDVSRNRAIAMEQISHGYWHIETQKIQAGDLYYFESDGKQLPDPASLSQPQGVHGPSQVIDIATFPWTDFSWHNPLFESYIIYELHTGTFSGPGTFEGIISRLGHLKALGINAIELMPVAQFPGTRNWGYDGVFPFCVQNSYGGAQALQQFVDTCHREGFAVILDVVYNHIGPEGNYLQQYGPYFTDKYKTPWGSAINFDDAWSDPVRHYFIENALMWLRDFHIDALRMDAIHAIRDFSPVHIVQEINEKVQQLNETGGSPKYLILETDQNDSRVLRPAIVYGFGARAQWCDDFHHSLRVALGQERVGYYQDFNGIRDLAKSLKQAYVFTGQYSEGRHRSYGTSTEGLNGDRFVVFAQNHDQVGNRMLGERLSQLVNFEQQKVAAAMVLLSPFVPMLFMGEEWAAETPFLYFTGHSDQELITAVEQGRKEEFAGFQHQGSPLPANDPVTFETSKLQWEEINEEPHATMLNFYKTLIRLRKTEPALNSNNLSGIHVSCEESKGLLIVERNQGNQVIFCVYNFSAQTQPISLKNAQSLSVILSSSDKRWSRTEIQDEYSGQEKRDYIAPASVTLLANYHVQT